MLTLRLAWRNITGAGLRTWLNVGVLSFIYVLVIWHQGILLGMQRHAVNAMISDEISGGQFWCRGYDPFDPLTIEDSHQNIPTDLLSLIDEETATPILVRPGTIYPKNRMQSILIKGIDPDQRILDIPSSDLQDIPHRLPVMVGKTMARKNGLTQGEEFVIRWRDADGTFDAIEGHIVSIMDTIVPAIDQGQIWVPLADLQELSGMAKQATLVVVDQQVRGLPAAKNWVFKDQANLLRDVNDMVNSKRGGAVFMYIILMFLAMLAIFDTQVLAIFRRRREIGTMMALGMPRIRVIGLFTLEGILLGILAIGVAAVYGIPALYYTAQKGLPISDDTSDWGFAVASRLFPAYSAALITGTVAIVMITITIVSFLPSRRIAKLNPTDALKGKLT
ncbi:MAG: FtsX-like permease family protein [Desulfobacteraceae bacterium]|nr:FtsX-like permease family protein [Desulfobacteraceae bacterium]